MSDTNIAYLETERVTHVAIWAQDQKLSTGHQAMSWTTEVVTLCGRKKKYIKRSELIYPKYAQRVPEARACKMCAEVVAQADRLLKLNEL